MLMAMVMVSRTVTMTGADDHVHVSRKRYDEQCMALLYCVITYRLFSIMTTCKSRKVPTSIDNETCGKSDISVDKLLSGDEPVQFNQPRKRTNHPLPQVPKI